MTAEAFPTTRKITRITLRKQTRSFRLMTEDRGRKKDLSIHCRPAPAKNSRLIAA